MIFRVAPAISDLSVRRETKCSYIRRLTGMFLGQVTCSLRLFATLYCDMSKSSFDICRFRTKTLKIVEK